MFSNLGTVTEKGFKTYLNEIANTASEDPTRSRSWHCWKGKVGLYSAFDGRQGRIMVQASNCRVSFILSSSLLSPSTILYIYLSRLCVKGWYVENCNLDDRIRKDRGISSVVHLKNLHILCRKACRSSVVEIFKLCQFFNLPQGNVAKYHRGSLNQATQGSGRGNVFDILQVCGACQ